MGTLIVPINFYKQALLLLLLNTALYNGTKLFLLKHFGFKMYNNFYFPFKYNNCIKFINSIDLD